MKTILEALEFCKENKLYDNHIKIALGINKVPMTIKEAFNQIRLRR
jgi:hypothetical protein|tara:strand:- start:1928 stop:2065 length:138 start_codon:yes stop_codon:yes gene_type:complete